MKHQTYKQLHEELFEGVCENGLHYYILPKKDFKKSVVCFGTKYGALTNEFLPLGKNEMQKVPFGIAHFLEHKLFEMSDGTDAITVFASLGLDANAYTDYHQTVYLFSGTEKVETGLTFLLDYVQEAYFTDENVVKEQGIIDQEIKMYLDMPRDRLHLGLMENLFVDYPLRVDIGGTLESIQKITKETLYDFYHTFYHPSNMILVFVGDCNPEHIGKLIEDNQSKKHYVPVIPIKRFIPDEPPAIKQRSNSMKMDIARPMASVGLKIVHEPFEKNQSIVHEVLMKILLEAYIGIASPFYQKLIDQKIVSDGLTYSVYFDRYVGFVKIHAYTQKPEQFIATIKEELIKSKSRVMRRETFNRFKKALLGSFLKALNSLDFISTLYIEHSIKDSDLFEAISEIQGLELADLKKIKPFLKEEYIADYTIYPLKKKKKS